MRRNSIGITAGLLVVMPIPFVLIGCDASAPRPVIARVRPLPSPTAAPVGAAEAIADLRRPASAAADFMSRDDLPADDVGLSIYLFAVGQADSMLIVGPRPASRTLLIDAGEVQGERSNNFRAIGRRIEAITGRKHVDYFLVSHFHHDHIGSRNDGLAGLIDELGFTVGTAIDAAALGAEYMKATRGTYDTYEANMARWVPAKVAHRVQAAFGTTQIDLGSPVNVDCLAFGGQVAPDANAFTAVVAAEPDRYENAPGSENDLSIALKISLGNFEFFTAGDLNGAMPSRATEPYTERRFGDKRETYTNVEWALVQAWDRQSPPREMDVEVYRADHHGSAYSSLPQLVDRLDPEFVVYSCGGGYDHPNTDVVTRIHGTAWQYVTSGLARSSWPRPDRFDPYGEILGEIQVHVSNDGQWYTINHETHKSYSDAEEDGLNVRTGGSGRDVGEENQAWLDE